LDVEERRKAKILSANVRATQTDLVYSRYITKLAPYYSSGYARMSYGASMMIAAKCNNQKRKRTAVIRNRKKQNRRYIDR